MSSGRSDKTDIPLQLYDAQNKKTYSRLRFFGKGGFAKCYEIMDVESKEVYAGKIISKKLMVKHNQKEKITLEISIHRSLKHVNIVKFHGFFDDEFNVYIVLELCKKRSMMELSKRRKTITEYECRYYMHQILLGVKYLHDNHIIHRDLKLGNLFLDDDLHIKIGDFGLAARIEFEGERKKTLCGTPNYIAPEILGKIGHSYEVDVWSIGCVMYTLLVGQPPFETNNIKVTYSKIQSGDYRVPQNIKRPAAEMIIAMLQSNPQKRPKVSELLNHDFMKSSSIPYSLPSSCLTLPPRSDQVAEAEKPRKPLTEYNKQLAEKTDSTVYKANLHDTITASSRMPHYHNPSENYKMDIKKLYDELTDLFDANPKRLDYQLGDEKSDPNYQVLYWISKWVDYSDKYGFGYQVSDDGMGVMFNDTTKLIMFANGVNIHFIDKDGTESYVTIDEHPSYLDKKIKLLTYFKRYMNEHLVKAGANAVIKATDSLSRMPHLHTWFRTRCAIIMHLTNGTVQFNFSDHVKIILCPHMEALTIMDQERNFKTFAFKTLKQGCPNDLYQKLRYAHEKINKLYEKLSGIKA